jgi:putative ABC transport system permease protein
MRFIHDLGEWIGRRFGRNHGLGLLLLGHNKLRLLLGAASVAFGVTVMVVEIALLTGVLDSQAMIATLVRGDLVVMSAARSDLHRWNTLGAVRLSQIAAIPGVARAIPVYEGHVGFKSPDDNRVRRIIVYAVPPDDMPLAIGGNADIARLLKFSHGFLFDARSRAIFGHIQPGQQIEIDKMPLTVLGTVTIGPDMVNDGAIVMSEGDWRARQPDAQPIMGVIRLDPGTDASTMAETIRAALPPDVTVMTPAELRSREDSATLKAAPIGILFLVGALAGLVIGAMNCYQLMFNEVSDHVPQYATLKAMGFSDDFLRRVILEQAALLALAGFVLGLCFSFLADVLMTWTTGLPVGISIAAGLLIWLFTAGMCILAGWMAVRRMAVADPAALY